MKAYHFGYQGHKPADLLETCRQLGAVVIDIRLRPLSRNPLWNKGKLQQMFGDSYVHVGALGNLNYKGGPIQIVDIESGLQTVMEQLKNRPVVIMCVCSDYSFCHRRVVAEELARQGVDVERLELIHE